MENNFGERLSDHALQLGEQERRLQQLEDSNDPGFVKRVGQKTASLGIQRDILNLVSHKIEEIKGVDPILAAIIDDLMNGHQTINDRLDVLPANLAATSQPMTAPIFTPVVPARPQIQTDFSVPGSPAPTAAPPTPARPQQQQQGLAAPDTQAQQPQTTQPVGLQPQHLHQLQQPGPSRGVSPNDGRRWFVTNQRP